MSRWPLPVALLVGLLLAIFAPRAFAQPAPVTSPAPSASAAPAKAPGKRTFIEAIPCSACHTTTSWKSKEASADGTAFDHSTTGFPLTGQHIGAPCVACHNSTRAVKRTCVSCHDDAHRGRLSQSCDNCHSPAGWKVTRPLEIHRMTRFPLTGMHVLADCSECHRRASEHRFTDAPIDCFACHEKDYRRTDLRPLHTGDATNAAFPRDCSLCHRPVAWVPAANPGVVTSSLSSGLRAAPPPRHDLRFPISFGVHRTASCEDCHASAAVPRAVRCIGCHAHEPVRLMQQHRQPLSTDGASCMGCHPGGARR
jgi:hypothetical protein